jgi:hypothetical protein
MPRVLHHPSYVAPRSLRVGTRPTRSRVRTPGVIGQPEGRTDTPTTSKEVHDPWYRVKRSQETDGMARPNTWNANQLRNSIPSTLSHVLFVTLLSMLISQVPRHRRTGLTISRHLRATWVIVSTPAHHQKFHRFPFSFLSKHLEVHSNRTPRIAKVSKATMLDWTNKHKGKGKQEVIASRRCETFIHPGSLLK